MKKLTSKTNKTNRLTRVFLRTLAECGNVSMAASQAGLNRSHVYELRESNEQFAREWDEAMDRAIDTLEAEA